MVQDNNTDGRQAFTARLKQAMSDAGYPGWGGAARLAREMNPRISERAVSKWLNAESMPDTKRLDQLASLLRVSVEWLLTGRPAGMPAGAQFGAPIESTKVPVVNFATLTAVSVGQDFDPAMMAVEWMPCPVKHGPRAFAFRVQDDANTSTTGARSYPAGCCLYVDPDLRDPVHEKPLLAVLPSGELLVAVYMAQAGSRWLRFLNPAYREYSGPFEVVGNIIGKWEDV